jgi:hypothetical protein
VTVTDASLAEVTHRFPYFLPDGKHFSFCEVTEGEGECTSDRWIPSKILFVEFGPLGGFIHQDTFCFNAQHIVCATVRYQQTQLSGEAVRFLKTCGRPQTWGHVEHLFPRLIFSRMSKAVIYRSFNGLITRKQWDSSVPSINMRGSCVFSDGKKFAISVVDGGTPHLAV